MSEKHTISNKYTIDNDQEVIIFKHGYGKIKFQHKPVKEAGANGLQVEDVISALIDRMLYLNGLHADSYNRDTINYLAMARDAQTERDIDRLVRGVEGEDVD